MWFKRQVSSQHHSATQRLNLDQAARVSNCVNEIMYWTSAGSLALLDLLVSSFY